MKVKIEESFVDELMTRDEAKAIADKLLKKASHMQLSSLLSALLMFSNMVNNHMSMDMVNISRILMKVGEDVLPETQQMILENEDLRKHLTQITDQLSTAIATLEKPDIPKQKMH